MWGWQVNKDIVASRIIPQSVKNLLSSFHIGPQFPLNILTVQPHIRLASLKESYNVIEIKDALIISKKADIKIPFTFDI